MANLWSEKGPACQRFHLGKRKNAGDSVGKKKKKGDEIPSSLILKRSIKLTRGGGGGKEVFLFSKRVDQFVQIGKRGREGERPCPASWGEEKKNSRLEKKGGFVSVVAGEEGGEPSSFSKGRGGHRRRIGKKKATGRAGPHKKTFFMTWGGEGACGSIVGIERPFNVGKGGKKKSRARPGKKGQRHLEEKKPGSSHWLKMRGRSSAGLKRRKWKSSAGEEQSVVRI